MSALKQVPVCRNCGGTEVLADAYAAWDIETQEWVISSTFDKGAVCADCDGETRLLWVDANEQP